ncbi:ABC transporter substrate-binding protein [Pelagibacterium mangrovi]|uniref:ABC transporter substrate-binding protein n=1 Tax=Pelagibacterium mangrovi TaxID=3119828 RepID=UPI002FC84438
MTIKTSIVALALGATLTVATPMLAVAQEDILRVGQSVDLTSFDPTQLRIGSYTSTFLLYNSLGRLMPDGSFQLELAESLDWSEDGKTLTIQLRDGVTFHDGRPMTAADVVFSLEYAATPEVGANVLPLARLIASVEAPDDRQVVLTVNGSQAAILDLLDLVFIIDSANPDAIATSGNGTGPYRLENHEPGRMTRFVRNENYWGEAPDADGVDIRIVPDAQTAVAQLQSGALDFLPVASRETIDQLANVNGVVTGIAAPEGRVLDLLMNVKDGPTANPHLRQAINLAIDRIRIASDVIGEGGVLKCLPWAEREIDRVAGYEDACRYDLEAARALVEEHGLAGTEVEFMTFAPAVPELGGMAQIVQYSLGEIGIPTRIVDLSEAAATQRYRDSDFELESHTFARGGRSAEAMLLTIVPFRPANNFSGIASEQYATDVGIVTGNAAPDEVADAWTRINDFMLSEAWILPVVSLPIRWASSERVENVSFNLDGMPILATATLK